MKIKDRICGENKILEPIIVEIINGPTLQRLKEIDQIGYFEPHFPGTAHSRFEHSVGVYLLLKKYGANLTEQIAGLIHDVSHSAFSHCIDYVLNTDSEKDQSHQDSVHDGFVKKSEIPSILKKYNINLEYILDDKNFPLKERELPDLCADRIDYSLRTAVIFKEIADASYFLENLVVNEKRWVFKTTEGAKKYAKLFKELNSKYYAGLQSAAMFASVGDYLKYAVSKKYISKKDLYTTDKLVLSKIAPHLNSDEKLNLLFSRMSGKTNFRNNPKSFDRDVFCKSRAVDPLCFHNGVVKHISEIDEHWGITLKIESKPKHYFIKFAK